MAVRYHRSRPAVADIHRSGTRRAYARVPAGGALKRGFDVRFKTDGALGQGRHDTSLRARRSRRGSAWADLPAQPWKTSGGLDAEIACWPPGAWAGSTSLWRISVARIDAGGPFSRFVGVDRVITLLERARRGAARRLRRGRSCPDAAARALRLPGRRGRRLRAAGRRLGRLQCDEPARPRAGAGVRHPPRRRLAAHAARPAHGGGKPLAGPGRRRRGIRLGTGHRPVVGRIGPWLAPAPHRDGGPCRGRGIDRRGHRAAGAERRSVRCRAREDAT